MSLSATPSRRSSLAVSLSGSVPDGSTSQRHCRAGPRGRARRCRPTTTSRYLKMGSLTIGSSCSPVTPGPKATSASRFAISTPSSPAAATPVVISTAPANRRRNASISGPATNSAKVEVATTRSCSGAPWAARTAACASAPSTTICEAVPSSRVPPGGQRHADLAAGDQLVAEVLAQRGDRLRDGGLADAERAGGGPDRPEPGHQDERVQLGQGHRTLQCGHRRSRRAYDNSVRSEPTGCGAEPYSFDLPQRGNLRESGKSIRFRRVHGTAWEARLQVPAQVEYEKASSVEHALALLARYAPGARILAGGHSLIPMMKLRLAQPEVLIDVNGLTSLRYIERSGGELRIGALARHADLLASPAAGEHVRDPARRRAGDRRPGGPELGHHRRLALPGRPVGGPVRRVRRAEGLHGHPRARTAAGRYPRGRSTPAPTRPSSAPGRC